MKSNTQNARIKFKVRSGNGMERHGSIGSFVRRVIVIKMHGVGIDVGLFIWLVS